MNRTMVNVKNAEVIAYDEAMTFLNGECASLHADPFAFEAKGREIADSLYAKGARDPFYSGWMTAWVEHSESNEVIKVNTRVHFSGVPKNLRFELRMDLFLDARQVSGLYPVFSEDGREIFVYFEKESSPEGEGKKKADSKLINRFVETWQHILGASTTVAVEAAEYIVPKTLRSLPGANVLRILREAEARYYR